MLEKIKQSTQALAQSAHIQVDLFPDFVEVADELALCWEEALKELATANEKLTEDQIESIKKLDQYMEFMSNITYCDLWNEAALFNSIEWETLRGLAIEVLQKMNWPIEPPPRTKDIYVGSK